MTPIDQMSARASTFFDERICFISSKELLSECTTFEQSGDDEYAAQKGRHDDRVITFALCLMAISQSPKLSAAMLRAQSGLPSAKQLGLSAAPATETAIPKHLAERLNVKTSMPWNPLGSEMPW